MNPHERKQEQSMSAFEAQLATQPELEAQAEKGRPEKPWLGTILAEAKQARAQRLEWAGGEGAAALDKFHVEEVDKALDHLAELERCASRGPWTTGLWGESVVNTDTEDLRRTAEAFDSYGGNLIFESARPADREFIIALREHAARLIFQARNWRKLFLERDELNRILGIDYSRDVVREVEALKGALRQSQVARADAEAKTDELREWQYKICKAVQPAQYPDELGKDISDVIPLRLARLKIAVDELAVEHMKYQQLRGALRGVVDVARRTGERYGYGV